MAHRVVWSPQALADVEAIAKYIEKDSPFYARAVVAKVVAATRNLGHFPLSGRIVPFVQGDKKQAKNTSLPGAAANDG